MSSLTCQSKLKSLVETTCIFYLSTGCEASLHSMQLCCIGHLISTRDKFEGQVHSLLEDQVVSSYKYSGFYISCVLEYCPMSLGEEGCWGKA